MGVLIQFFALAVTGGVLWSGYAGLTRPDTSPGLAVLAAFGVILAAVVALWFAAHLTMRARAIVGDLLD